MSGSNKNDWNHYLNGSSARLNFSYRDDSVNVPNITVPVQQSPPSIQPPTIPNNRANKTNKTNRISSNNTMNRNNRNNKNNKNNRTPRMNRNNKDKNK